MTPLIPKGPRLLIRSIYDTMTAGGLHVPQVSQDRRKVAKAEVLAVGAEVEQFKVGDVVHFMSGSAVAIDHDSGQFMVIKAEEVLAVENPEFTAPTLLPLELLTGDAEVPRLDAEAFEA